MTSYTPDKVAQSFLKQYYQMLSTNPDDLFRFYNEQSSFTHCYGQHPEPAARGQSAIREKVAALDLAGARVDLSNGSVDAQLSVDNAVFVTVTGTFTARDGVPRPFVQSFFLATQPGAQNSRSYFVMNSVFRQLSIDVPVAREHAVAEKATQHQQVEADKGAGSAPQAAEQQKAPVQAAAPAAQQPQQVQQAAAPAQPAAAETAAAEPAAAQEAPAAAAAAAQEQPAAAAPQAPKSFLDAVKKSLPANGSAPAAAQAPAPRQPRQSRPAAAAQPREEKPEAKEEAPVSQSIWVSNIGEGASPDDLRALFGKFGNIQNVEIPQGRGFAFVDFDTPDAVQAVLNSGEQFTLNDKPLRVEAKTSSTRAAGRKGAPGKPRGASPKSGERREKSKEPGARREGKRSPAPREGGRQQAGGASGAAAAAARKK